MSIMRFHILDPSRVWVSDNVVVLPLGSIYHATTLHAKIKAFTPSHYVPLMPHIEK